VPPATLRQKRAQETRQLILKAAYQTFSDRGYGQTRIDSILARAGISKGAFYHHFDGKEDIFNALLEEHVRRCADDMAEAVKEARSLPEALEAIVASSIEAYTRDPVWTRLFMEFWVQATRDPFSRSVLARSMAQCRSLSERVLREAQASGVVRLDLDPAQAAAVLVGIFDGIAIQAAIDPGSISLPEFATPLTDLIQRFIEPPEGETP
jgi:AcrR family transcriptional regulator